MVSTNFLVCDVRISSEMEPLSLGDVTIVSKESVLAIQVTDFLSTTLNEICLVFSFSV